MKLLAKFNLILGLVLGAGLLIAAAVSHSFLQNDAREDVLRQARLMMQAMQAARDYTTNEVKPVLVAQQEEQNVFLPQTVPAFAATQDFAYLRAAYPDYAYKEATLNPTNLRDRAADWEADVINSFRNHSGSKELVGERDTPTGRSLYLAKPIVALAAIACSAIARPMRRRPRWSSGMARTTDSGGGRTRSWARRLCPFPWPCRCAWRRRHSSNWQPRSPEYFW